jgi:hypothetical protein
MSFSLVDAVIMQFEDSYKLLKAQTEGLTHADSLLQLPFRGNCLNWILGHLVHVRGRLLLMLGAQPAWNKAEAARYARGSAPILGQEDGIYTLEQLLTALDTTQERLITALRAVNEADLGKPIGDQTLFFWIVRIAWHDGYHAGQVEYLRQLAGKDDQITL